MLKKNTCGSEAEERIDEITTSEGNTSSMTSIFYFRLRVLGYPNTQVVLICFAFDSPDSLSCVLDKWAPEVKHYCHNVPILLIANKLDLRDDSSVHERIKNQNQQIITTEDALLCAQKIGARNYLECSAKTRQGVREVFEYAAKIALDRDSHEKCFCHCVLL
jgi:GTPase SAR1 family protein